METVEAAHPTSLPGNPCGITPAPTAPTATTTGREQDKQLKTNHQSVTHVPGLICHLSARLLQAKDRQTQPLKGERSQLGPTSS